MKISHIGTQSLAGYGGFTTVLSTSHFAVLSRLRNVLGQFPYFA